jgi:DNA primase
MTDIATLRAVTDEAGLVFTERARRLAAPSYLRQRAIFGAHLSSRWLVGYAPPGWTRLVDTLRVRFSDDALIDAGVARRSSRGTLDRHLPQPDHVRHSRP